jgi:glycosyltransferase involved in cell wall biosynthesis
VLAEAGHDVTILGPVDPDRARFRERLGVDLSACRWRRVVDDAEASAASEDYDLFVNGTYLSTAVNRAATGWYYVHFPGQVRTARDRARTTIGVAGVKALRAIPVAELPLRLREVQAGFDRRIDRTEFVATYDRYLANSAFTAGWVQRLWGREADVVHPPVRPTVHPGDKRALVLSLGRFFDPALGHSKKQHEMLRAFVDLERRDVAADWQLALVGGADATSREYVLAARRAAIGHRVGVHVNAKGALVEELLGAASIYWHASGFGEDAERHPERFEHFGIALVEAMAAGAAPVVYGAAGPAEIVRDGVDGRHWRTLDELAEVTAMLMGDPVERARLAEAARRRAADFSLERFRTRLLELVTVR